jgi:hypothetical protein
MSWRFNPLLPALALAAGLTAGCERLGIEDPATVAVAREAEGKAVGAGCRHAGRSLEDCYAMNERALKAAVFAGWKEMNDYMAANKIDVIAPQLAQAAVEAEAPAVKPEAGKPAGHAAEQHVIRPPAPARRTAE